MILKLKNIIMALFASVFMMFRSFAATDNPMTGDTAGRYLWVVLAALGISLVVIIVIVATSGKGKK